MPKQRKAARKPATRSDPDAGPDDGTDDNRSPSLEKEKRKRDDESDASFSGLSDSESDHSVASSRAGSRAKRRKEFKEKVQALKTALINDQAMLTPLTRADDGAPPHKKGRVPQYSWSDDVDVALSRAYVNVSTDPIRGTDQTLNDLFVRIHAKLQIILGNKKELPTIDKMKTRIKEIVEWWATYNKVLEAMKSGEIEDEVAELRTDILFAVRSIGESPTILAKTCPGFKDPYACKEREQFQVSLAALQSKYSKKHFFKWHHVKTYWRDLPMCQPVLAPKKGIDSSEPKSSRPPGQHASKRDAQIAAAKKLKEERDARREKATEEKNKKFFALTAFLNNAMDTLNNIIKTCTEEFDADRTQHEREQKEKTRNASRLFKMLKYKLSINVNLDQEEKDDINKQMNECIQIMTNSLQ